MEEKFVLGIHVGHDRSVALIKNGNVVGNIAQERLDRIKHSRSIELPFESIDALLKYQHIEIQNVNCVGLSGDAMEAENILNTIKSELYIHYNCKIQIGRAHV